MQVALIQGIIFTVTLIGRPVGGIVFGLIADLWGKKQATLIAIIGFGVGSLLLGFLAGFEEWGVTALVLLIAIRFLIGVCIGGENTGASPLAMELAPKRKRGFFSGIIQSGFAMAYVGISIVTFLVLQIAPAGDVHSPYVQWGWRIAFFIGALLSLIFSIYIWRRVPTEQLPDRSERRNPLKELFSRGIRRDLLQVIILMTGFWLSIFMITAVMPLNFVSVLGLTSSESSLALVIVYVFITGAFILAGRVSQRIGRRRFLMIWGLVVAILGTASYGVLMGMVGAGFLLIVVMATVTSITGGSRPPTSPSGSRSACAPRASAWDIRSPSSFRLCTPSSSPGSRASCPPPSRRCRWCSSAGS